MTPEAVVKLSKALADPTRFRILQAIAATEEIACGALAARFPITQGLCGAALDSGKPVIVGDVSKDLRYLPTFHTTRSEIIVPMRNDHRHVLGMLDAESDKLNAFSDEDLQFLERAGGLIAHCLH